MEKRQVFVEELRAVNGPQDAARIADLAASMAREGWRGAELLVEENPRGMSWAGSHRIQAALAAGIEEVPALVLTASELDTAFRAAGHDRLSHGYQSWRDYATHLGDGGDDGRIALLREVGLSEAAHHLDRDRTAGDEWHAGRK